MTKLIFAALLLLAAAAVAQEPAPTGTPPASRDSLEPGVDTSAPSQSQPAQSRPAQSQPSSSQAPSAQSPAARTPARPAASANKPANANARRPGAQDYLDLESTQITGNRELPKVLYIVPWRSAELGDLVGRPVNSLLDEVLEPVDRDVFRRQNRYFEALQPNQAAPAAQPEK